MKGNLIIMGCFAAGIAAARMDLLPAWLLSHDVPVYILSALIFQVGIGLGASNDLQRMKQSFGAGMILLPAATIIGTLLFSAAGVFLLGDRSLADCLALGSGFGRVGGVLRGVRAHRRHEGCRPRRRRARHDSPARQHHTRDVGPVRSIALRPLGRPICPNIRRRHQLDGRMPAHDRARGPRQGCRAVGRHTRHGPRGERTDTDRYILRRILLTPKRMRTIMTDIACGVPDGAFIYSHRPAAALPLSAGHRAAR